MKTPKYVIIKKEGERLPWKLLNTETKKIAGAAETCKDIGEDLTLAIELERKAKRKG